MTKSDLLEALVQELRMGDRDARVVVETVLDFVTEALRRGERVELRGFGTFGVRKRRPRIGRNPRSGDRVHVPAKRVPYFKPGRILKAELRLGKPAARRTSPPAPEEE